MRNMDLRVKTGGEDLNAIFLCMKAKPWGGPDRVVDSRPQTLQEQGRPSQNSELKRKSSCRGDRE